MEALESRPAWNPMDLWVRPDPGLLQPSLIARPYSQHTKICQRFFQDIYQMIVAERVGRFQEESGVKNVADRVVQNAFRHLAVLEFDLNPQAFHGGIRLKELDLVVIGAALKALHEEERLQGVHSLLDHCRRLLRHDGDIGFHAAELVTKQSF